jgi:RNA-directed DNA polymerase
VALRTLPDLKINRKSEVALRLGLPLAVLEALARDKKDHYARFKKKINGKERDFYDGDEILRKVHSRIDKRFLNRFAFPPSIQGGIKGRSLLTNAKKHVGKGNLAHFDVQHFFPNIKPKKVYEAFVSVGCAPDVARLLTQLVTEDRHVPQGFSTSPKVAGLALLHCDARLIKFFKEFGLRHTFWIDDLCVSGHFPIRKLEGTIASIFSQEGFPLHETKRDYMYAHQRQKVGGIVVNKKPAVNKNTSREIRKILYVIQHFGIRSGMRTMFPTEKISKKDFLEKVRGKISYMMSVDRDKYQPLMTEWKVILKTAKF